jgi:hypothetical protein
MILVSCNRQKTTNSEQTNQDINTTSQNDLIKDSLVSNIIEFNLDDFKEIIGYKNIDLDSKDYLYDNYLQPIDSMKFQLECYDCYNQTEKYNNKKTFFVDMEYGKVKFESIDEDDMFLEYHYLDKLVISNFKIVVLYSIDIPYTIFLDSQVYSGFRANGTITLSNNKEYFVSVSNMPDYTLLEIYKVAENKIINIVNLYSVDYPIDKMCWDKELFFETVIMNNVRYYYKIDWTKILHDWNKINKVVEQ